MTTIKSSINGILKILTQDRISKILFSPTRGPTSPPKNHPFRTNLSFTFVSATGSFLEPSLSTIQPSLSVSPPPFSFILVPSGVVVTTTIPSQYTTILDLLNLSLCNSFRLIRLILQPSCRLEINKTVRSTS